MAFVPANPVPRGALVIPGLAMIAGLLIAPALAALRDLRTALRAENILALAVVFWIYLDLVPGAYEMEPIGRAEVRGVFGITGVFVIAMWAASLQQAWRIPRVIREISVAEWSGAGYFYFALAAFTLGFLRFAIPARFDLIAILHYMGEMRWAAPWARGQLGGWNAFLDVLQYFGYMVPMLTVLAARRLGWLNGRILLLICLNVVMVLLLAQGGGRRIVGTLGGSALSDE